MSSGALRSHAADLAWSLWAELGVSGTIRNHSFAEIDPEPLLAATPALAAEDPRLLEQAISWCAAHGDHVNASRLSSLVQGLPPFARTCFEEFGATVNAAAGTKWPAAGEPWLPLPRLRDVALPLERRALVRLRARALCGVGTRADILCDLVARPREWTTAAKLAEGGHSKRNVARVLSDFEAARLVARQVSGNALGFRLAQPAAVGTVLGEMPAAHPEWVPLLHFALLLLDLAGIEDLPEPVRRVETTTRRDAVAPFAERLWVDSPPATRGSPDAWQALLAWATAKLEELANGSCPAFGVPAVRAAELSGGAEAWVWLAEGAPAPDRVAALLQRPTDGAGGVWCTAAMPTADGWMGYQLHFSPSLASSALRAKVEHLVAPLKVHWRTVEPSV